MCIRDRRQPCRVRRGPSHRQRDAEDGVGTQPALVGRAVQVDQRLVQDPLLGRLVTDELRTNVVEHRADSLLDALAAVPVAAVTQLHRLEGAGGGAAGHGRAGQRAVVEGDLDLYGGVAAGVEDLPGANSLDGRHESLLSGGRCERDGRSLPAGADAVRLPRRYRLRAWIATASWVSGGCPTTILAAAAVAPRNDAVGGGRRTASPTSLGYGTTDSACRARKRCRRRVKAYGEPP